MSIFKRVFKMGQAEANAIVDKMEDPIRLTEQGIRDLKKDLEQSLKAFAEVKAIAIRTRRQGVEANDEAKSWEQKAVMLLQKAQTGAMPAADAERLATEALSKKKEFDSQAATFIQQANQLDGKTTQLEGNIKKLKTQITNFENELRTLKARVKVSEATTSLNKQMAQIDSDGTVSMLERMKEKVEKQEALADAYGEMANANTSVDDEINKALEGVNLEVSDELAALKAKLSGGNINPALNE
jgi:phage shock protein A